MKGLCLFCVTFTVRHLCNGADFYNTNVTLGPFLKSMVSLVFYSIDVIWLSCRRPNGPPLSLPASPQPQTDTFVQGHLEKRPVAASVFERGHD